MALYRFTINVEADDEDQAREYVMDSTDYYLDSPVLVTDKGTV